MDYRITGTIKNTTAKEVRDFFEENIPILKDIKIEDITPKEDPFYTKFLNSNKDLFRKHSLTTTGLWQIFGEDPNCDFGGSHSEPLLGVMEGQLERVVRAAVAMKGFWQWGAGGRIKKIEVLKV